ncbi:MAG: hypothetical protein ACE5GJ_06295, partial [Gemmatimonadota bacterium]
MSEALEREIRTLRTLFWSERDPDGRAFAPLADALRRAGEFRQAMDLLTEGRERLPDFVPGHVVAARLYVETGLAGEAELAARRALELDDENVEALRVLTSVLEEKGEGEEAAQLRARLHELDPEAGAAAETAEEAAEVAAEAGAE